MELHEYQKLALRTNADLGNKKLNLAHMVLGMCSELPELEDAIDNKDPVNIGEELADTYWYVANYETERGYQLDIFERKMAGGIGIDFLYHDVGLLQDLVKKYIAYNREIDENEEKLLLSLIKVNLDNIFISYGLSRSEYLQKNIDKLKQRYPDKFTTENALNRDLDAERKILES